MSSYGSAALCRLVVERADYLCEYGLIHEDDAFFGCEVDHIISEKHGGPAVAEHLAYGCAFCNRAKGSDIGSIMQRTGAFCRFFNPRTDRWAEHFALDGVTIIPLSDIGEVTVRPGTVEKLHDSCNPTKRLHAHTIDAAQQGFYKACTTTQAVKKLDPAPPAAYA